MMCKAFQFPNNPSLAAVARGFHIPAFTSVRTKPKIFLSSLLSFTRLGAGKMTLAYQYIKLCDTLAITRDIWVWGSRLAGSDSRAVL